MLRVDRISKTYGALLALRELSFAAAPGQVIGLLGPNGSGKSTAINVITGLLEATSGTVRWNGQEIHTRQPDYNALLGYVPEEPRLYDYMSAPEYLAMVGGLRGIEGGAVERRIDRYLELFGLDTDRYAPLAYFSKGMRQKVLISAALLHDPLMVVLDEPCSGLDVGSTLVLRSLIRALAADGKVVIYSSHLMDMVEKVCSDVIILSGGMVVAQDSVARLRDLSHSASLEQVFAALAVDPDVEEIGRSLCAVSKIP